LKCLSFLSLYTSMTKRTLWDTAEQLQRPGNSDWTAIQKSQQYLPIVAHRAIRVASEPFPIWKRTNQDNNQSM
jgi:hypothetical protein